MSIQPSHHQSIKTNITNKSTKSTKIYQPITQINKSIHQLISQSTNQCISLQERADPPSPHPDKSTRSTAPSPPLHRRLPRPLPHERLLAPFPPSPLMGQPFPRGRYALDTSAKTLDSPRERCSRPETRPESVRVFH